MFFLLYQQNKWIYSKFQHFLFSIKEAQWLTLNNAGIHHSDYDKLLRVNISLFFWEGFHNVFWELNESTARHFWLFAQTTVKKREMTSSISSLVRIWKIHHSGPGCSFVWILWVVYFSVRHIHVHGLSSPNFGEVKPCTCKFYKLKCAFEIN